MSDTYIKYVCLHVLWAFHFVIDVIDPMCALKVTQYKRWSRKIPNIKMKMIMLYMLSQGDFIVLHFSLFPLKLLVQWWLCLGFVLLLFIFTLFHNFFSSSFHCIATSTSVWLDSWFPYNVVCFSIFILLLLFCSVGYTY